MLVPESQSVSQSEDWQTCRLKFVNFCFECFCELLMQIWHVSLDEVNRAH